MSQVTWILDALGGLGDPDDLRELDNLCHSRFHLMPITTDLDKLDDLNNLSNFIDMRYLDKLRDLVNLLG